MQSLNPDVYEFLFDEGISDAPGFTHEIDILYLKYGIKEKICSSIVKLLAATLGY